MKIALKKYRGSVVLDVTEEVSARDIVILKAGLPKIAQTKAKFVLVDFSSAKVRKEVLEVLPEYQAAGYDMGMLLVFVSKASAIGNAKDLDDALVFTKSKQRKDVVVRRMLRTKIEMLRIKKAKNDHKIEEMEAAGFDMALLQAERRSLDFVIGQMESQVKEYVDNYREPVDLAPVRVLAKKVETLVRNEIAQKENKL